MLVKFYECCSLSFFNFDDYVGFDDGDGGGFDCGFYDRCMVIFYRAREGNVRAPPRYFAGYPDSPFVR